MKNQMKGKKGITLIALVITIIVLLILAGVTIATLTGDNGLLQKATNAKQANEEATALEKIKVEVAGSYGLDGKIDTEQLNKSLLKLTGLMYKNAPLSEENSIELPANVELDNNSYHITNDGTVTPIKPQAIGSLTKDNYGDYLDLGKNIVKTSATIDDWKIIYNDKIDGKIYAILADYLPNNFKRLDTDEKSITDNVGLAKVGTSSYNVNQSTAQKLWDGFNSDNAKLIYKEGLISEDLFQNDKITVEGAIPAEKLMDSYNEKHGTNFDYNKKDVVLYLNPKNAENGLDPLYVPHFESLDGCYGYWLNSTFKNTGLTMLLRNDGLIASNHSTDSWRALCPIVILDSDLQVTSITSNGKTVWSLLK